jgi:hypothetical protein
MAEAVPLPKLANTEISRAMPSLVLRKQVLLLKAKQLST